MNILRKYFLAIAIFLLACPCYAGGPEGTLLKIVALSRHGVRAPTQSETVLSMWSQKAWPRWPVAKGDLTPRGAALITAMWSNLRIKFQEYGILQENSCPQPNSVYVRADVDERTKATARAMLDGLAPGCSMGFAVAREKIDPLFHPVKAGLYKFDPFPAATDVLSALNGGLSGLQDDFAGAISLISRISGPPSPKLCLRFTSMPKCQISDLSNAISVSPDGTDIRLLGSLDVASSMAEIFLLEYAEWPGVPAGWGQVDATTLSQVLPVHSKVFDVINRAPVVAWAKGSSLLTEMKNALLGTHYDPRCNEAKLVVYVGHDTNIANIGSLLGITWQPSGYAPNGIPPGAALFLELWEIQGKKRIIVRFYAQAPKVLHSALENEKIGMGQGTGDILEFAPVAAVVNAPPVVGEARFDVNQFIDLVLRATEGAPIAPQLNPPLDFNKVVPAKP